MMKVTKKKGVKGKPKGNKYEIIISRILSKWYANSFVRKRNEKEDYFWRTAGSGAKATRGKGAETSFFGDITFLPAPDALQVWIDCKSVKTLTFNSILTDSFLPYRWYGDECLKQMDILGNVQKPILIIFNRYRETPKTNYVFFNLGKFEPLKRAPKEELLVLERDGLNYAVMKLPYFLNSIDREDIVNES